MAAVKRSFVMEGAKKERFLVLRSYPPPILWG